MRIIISDGSFINVDDVFEKVDSNIEISGVMFIKVMRGFDISVGCFMNVDGIFMNVDGDF